MTTQARGREGGLVQPMAPFYRRYPTSVFRFARQYPLGAVGAFFVIVLILVAVVPQAFTPLATQDQFKQAISDRLQAPSSTHWFGTDELGRDLYARIVHGARTSIIIGFGVVVLSQLLAITFGTLSGFRGGLFDTIFQRLIDIGIAVPGLVFIILVVQTLAGRMGDLLAIVLSLSLLISASSSRTVRGVALSITTEQYVDAARSLGAHDLRVMVRHVVPNLTAIAIVSASILVGNAVLIESSLSFLGYGIQPPTPSWGRMLNDARQQMIRAPHLAIFPGLVIFMTVYSFNMLGDALRDKLDPRLRGTR
ncbi:MAG: ABC transporter permease [Chloroflexi bacterium]|nr:ABC transporter permease [Chloroflexota bacterium]MDA1003375.1 ABC transporter permease [Chloroflexota bacterium]